MAARAVHSAALGPGPFVTAPGRVREPGRDHDQPDTGEAEGRAPLTFDNPQRGVARGRPDGDSTGPALVVSLPPRGRHRFRRKLVSVHRPRWVAAF